MAYIVAEPCINCKYTDCVEVCPVDCFYEGPNFLVIDPDESVRQLRRRRGDGRYCKNISAEDTRQ